MLTELQKLHADILAGLDQLDALTAQPEPPMERLPAVRLALTRASRARTLFLEGIYESLSATADSETRAMLDELKVEGKSNMLVSAKHIGSWTLRTITQRWPDYCAASKAMRTAMRARIRSEARLIYPLLSSYGENRPRG